MVLSLGVLERSWIDDQSVTVSGDTLQGLFQLALLRLPVWENCGLAATGRRASFRRLSTFMATFPSMSIDSPGTLHIGELKRIEDLWP